MVVADAEQGIPKVMRLEYAVLEARTTESMEKKMAQYMNDGTGWVVMALSTSGPKHYVVLLGRTHEEAG